MKLKFVLAWIVSELGKNAVITFRDESVYITSRESILITRMIDLTGLSGNHAELCELIQRLFAPNTWNSKGIQAPSLLGDDLLVFTNDPEVAAQIGKFIVSLPRNQNAANQPAAQVPNPIPAESRKVAPKAGTNP